MPDWIIYFNISASLLWAYQIVFGFLSYRRNARLRLFHIDERPKLSVVIPAYNETPETIQKVVDSVVMQRRVQIEVFVVDDGSDVPVCIKKHSQVTLARLPENKGKRHAQLHAIRQCNFDWIVTVDSDTALQPDALYALYHAAVSQKVDAVTGHVLLKNEKQNILTRMIACLYWYGFCQERASQSYFGSVVCCSGALSLWRKSVILETADVYLNQKFMNKECIAGDDRFLTCLFALNDKKIGFALDARACTLSPSTVGGFLWQQLRWSRSNTPALAFMLKNLHRTPFLFISFMMAVMFRYTYFSVLYVCILALMIQGQFFASFYIFLWILVVSGAKTLNAFLYTRKLSMLYLMPLSVLSFFVFSPVIIYGALTPTSTGWLTRKKKEWATPS